MPTYDEQKENKKIKKKKKREGVSNVRNFNEFKKKITLIRVGEKITPKKIGMENERRNFYNWIRLLTDVEKINGRYIKVA